MSSLRDLAPAMSWRIAATLACVTLAASPGFAAPRHAPRHASHPTAQGAGQAGGASAPIGQAKPEGGDAATPVDTTAAKTTPKEPADRGGKATDNKSVGPIDLTRPDDGYGNHANLRRRAARASLIAAHKKPPVVSPGAPHPPVTATAEHPRNSAGVAMPGVPNLPAPAGAAKAEPVHTEPTAATAFGGGKNNLGLSATGVQPAPVHLATTPAPPKPVVGINGTTLHQSGPGIGGPAKEHSAIAGSSYRHK
jgi:hypothetical protein